MGCGTGRAGCRYGIPLLFKPGAGMTVDPSESLMKHFDFDSLPNKYAEAVKMHKMAATHLLKTLPPGSEKTVAIRKLLESRDAALRAVE